MVSIEEQLKYIYYLKSINIYSEEEYDKSNKNIKSLFLGVKFFDNYINDTLQNTLIKLTYSNYAYKYLNNLPLNLKFLHCNTVNCNLQPNIIYLECYFCDVNNLPRSLQFSALLTYNNIYIIIIPTELINHNYNKNEITFLNTFRNNFDNIKKLKSIY